MTDYTELKELAELTKTMGGDWYTVASLKSRIQNESDRGYIAAASPDAILSLIAENERMREALTIMVDEKCDYMKLNNLGDPEKQHTIKLARVALGGK